MKESNATTRVVIVGGGFAGINFVKKLAGDQRFQVTMVDRNNYHFFPPLLYQISTAFIEPSNISYPFRRMFQGKSNLRFHLGALTRVDTVNRLVETENGSLPYDYLILALGTETNFFGMENVQRHALPMKTVDEALNLRNHLLLNMEKATRTSDEATRERLRNIVIAGGGPTGVELAGMLAEMGRNIVRKEYPEFKDFGGYIYLIDAGPVLLAPMSKKAQTEAKKVLTRLGVRIITDTAVKDYVDGEVVLADGRTIPTNALIWASGVIAREVPGLPAEAVTRGRRLKVDAYNRVQGFENIFALGDLCFQETDPGFPKGHPQVAQVAIQQGQRVAKNLRNLAAGKPLVPFRYFDKGSMAIISKFEAVADLPGVFFKGLFAWLVWLFIHILPLVGFRNKLQLAFNWAYSFITNDPTLRLIIRPRDEDKKTRMKEELAER